MSSVRNGDDTNHPTRDERPILGRPVCASCKTPVEHTPGKRPKLYCSPACKMRVKRALAAAEKAGEKAGGPATPTAGRGGTSRAKSNARLGTTGKTTDMQVSGPFAAPGDPKANAGDAARDGRFQLREDLREKGVTRAPALIECGCRVLAGGVTPVLRNGRAGYAGVATCGSVHICPVCGTTIRATRRDELDTAGSAWEDDHGGLVMMTLTMRHFRRQPLLDLADQQRDAWRLAFGQNAGRTWRQAKTGFGVDGYVRAWEVIHGPNGWHVHYHVLIFMVQPWTRAQVEEFQHLAFELWSAALERVGAYLPIETDEKGRPIGVRVDAPDRGEGGDLARYLMKGQDGKTSWGAAAEMTRADVKVGGSAGYRTPFEIARAAVLDDADPDDIRLWREFESGAKGIRALYWSNGLRAKLKQLVELDDRTDAQVAADDAAAGERLALIPAATWYRHVVRKRGRALALLRAAEKLGAVGVRTLIESWGLVWGVDVLEPEEPPAAALPTADEVLRQTERAGQADRQEVWRREFDRQEVEAASQARGGPQPLPVGSEARALVARERVRSARREAAMTAELVGRERDMAAFLTARRAANAARADDLQQALERVRSQD